MHKHFCIRCAIYPMYVLHAVNIVQYIYVNPCVNMALKY